MNRVDRAAGTQNDLDKRLKVRDFSHHPRDWRGFRYVYPVLSRRSSGLSIGVNLNPDTACNFDCIYCQVNRSGAPRVREVHLDRLIGELDAMLEAAMSGQLFSEPEFAATPPEFRRLNDIAFSGDGEPTTCPLFGEVVAAAIDLKRKHAADHVKIILITDACYLTKPAVAAGLELIDAAGGEIWAKLDAGTEAYYQQVNRPNYPLSHVLENIIDASRKRPVTIQSLFMRIDGAPPPEEEILAFADRLNEIQEAGGRIRLVQVYTVARPPAQACVTALANAEVDHIVKIVRDRTELATQSFYGS